MNIIHRQGIGIINKQAGEHSLCGLQSPWDALKLRTPAEKLEHEPTSREAIAWAIKTLGSGTAREISKHLGTDFKLISTMMTQMFRRKLVVRERETWTVDMRGPCAFVYSLPAEVEELEETAA